MSELISRTARLVPYAKRPRQLASFVTAYVYEPEADEAGARLGNLYVVVEVLVSGRASEEVVDLIIQTAGDKYYNEVGDQLDPLARFEAAIKQTNHELSEYVGRGNAAWIGKLSAIIAVQAGNELHVAQTGSAEAFLYRAKAVSHISQSETARPNTPSKTFGSIATGELEAGDRLLIATPALIHQVPLTKLQLVIANTGPNAAIQELSQLLEGAITNRIAAIVVEITTPELAALKVRSEAPAEIKLAGSENIAEVAFKAAGPIAISTAQSSRKAAQVAFGHAQSLKPHLRRSALSGAALLRRTLSTSKRRRVSLALAILAVLGLGIFLWSSANTASSNKQFTSYQALFQQYAAARIAATGGDKAGARRSLSDIQVAVNKLSPHEDSINHSLKNSSLLEGEPTSVVAFKALLTDQLDQLDGLIKVRPMTVATISAKNARPEHFESDGTYAYVIDSGNRNAISIVNLATGVQKVSSANTVPLNGVINTTLSATNDGMFILTDKPSVWFYRFATNTLTEQTLAYGSWPKARAIASYGSNIYLLGDTAVYKHVRNATGYSPKTDYIPTTGTTALAVDGWIYVLSGSSLNRFLGSALKQSLTTPATLGEITNLRSAADGNVLIGTSTRTNRIALWSAAKDQLVFSKQISLLESKTLRDATYDPKLGKVFAIVDNRLVSFAHKP